VTTPELALIYQFHLEGNQFRSKLIHKHFRLKKMKKIGIIFRGVIIFILISGCVSNKYISDVPERENYEGKWQFRDHQDRILQITKIEDNIYNLKFDSETNDWEGIGYDTGSELMAIFKYYYIDQRGYITFKFIEKDKIQFRSINPYGEYRSEGFFVRIKTQ